MTLTILEIISIVESIVVVVSVIFIWYELRENRKLTKAAQSQALIDALSPYNMAIVQDRQFASFLFEGASKYEAYDDVDKYRFETMILNWLIVHENVFYQFKKGFIEPSSYKAWQSDLRLTIKQTELWRFWPNLKEYLEEAFVAHADIQIQRAKRDAQNKSNANKEVDPS